MNRNNFKSAQLRLVLLQILVFGLIACGEVEPYQPDTNRGKALFNQTHIGQSLGCITCHTFSVDIKTVGPSLFGISTRAALAKPSMSAKTYLYESITNPDAHVIAGYEPNIMYTGYADELSKEELSDLVAFLLSQ